MRHERFGEVEKTVAAKEHARKLMSALISGDVDSAVAALKAIDTFLFGDQHGTFNDAAARKEVALFVAGRMCDKIYASNGGVSRYLLDRIGSKISVSISHGSDNIPHIDKAFQEIFS